MKRDSLWYGLIFLYAMIIIFVQFSLQFDFFTLSENVDAGVQLFFTFLTPLVAIVAGLVALKYFGLKTMQSKGILLLVIGLALWFVADIIWYFVESETISPADFFYLLGYVLIFAGTIFGILTVKSDFFRSGKWLGLFIACLFFVSILYYFFPIGWDEDISFLQNFVTAGYIAIDFLILVSVLFIIGLAFTGTFSKPWVVIALAMCSTVVGDVLYAFKSIPYEAGELPWIDITWFLAYLLYATAFILLRQKTEELLMKA